MKRISERKTGSAPPSSIDQEEVDAALQLIQLSGDSAGETPKPNNIASPPDLVGPKAAEEAEEESFGNNTVNGGGGGGNYSSISSSVDDQISSTTITTTTMNDDVADSLDDDNVADNLDDDEAFPSRKRKFRSVSDLYLKTKPLFKRRQKKGKNKVELLINK